jgi:malonyl-CoA O-methyltransferase
MQLTQSVAKGFSKAAQAYKHYDVLQRQTAASLLSKADLSGRLLDVGAGPGTCFAAFKQVDQVIALDIAQGMLTTLSQSFPHYHTLCCDAQAINLAANTIDSVYSNLALQWCDNLPQAISELNRVLVDGGQCHLSIVANGSMPQLQALGFSVNQFDSLALMLSAFDDKQWHRLDAHIETVTVYFDDLRSLLYSIKGVGASQTNLNGPVPIHLSKSQWQKRLTLAEALRTEKGIPLSYNIAYIRAQNQ